MKSILEGREVPRPGQRRICPAVMILLDDDVAGLGADLVMEMARWHPDALAFATAVRMTGKEGEDRRRRLLRVAMEAVTDVVARRQALQLGYFIEDTVRVFLVFSAGSTLADGALSTVLQTVHRVAAEFFDQTSLEVHALVFLPDLADAWERELRYRDAYRKLLEVDEAGATDHALAHRPHSSLDHRWFVDSRTRSGAHAGRLSEVRSPVAEFLAALLDGREEGPSVAARMAREQLRAQVRERHSAYSTFGVAVLFHYPDMLLRALTCYAGERYLGAYAGQPRAVTATEADPLLAGPSTVLSSDFGTFLRDWSAEIRQQFQGVMHPDFRASARLSAEDRSRQNHHRRSILEGIDAWMERGIREVLAAGGIPLARRLLDALRRTAATDDPVAASAAAVGELRLGALGHLREFLALDRVVAHENELRANQERLDAPASGADSEQRDEAERALEQQVSLRRRLEAVLEAEGDPDELEERLLAVLPELERLPPAPVALSTPVSIAPPTIVRTAEKRESEADRKQGFFARVWARVRNFFNASPVGSTPPVAPAIPKRRSFWPSKSSPMAAAERDAVGKPGEAAKVTAPIRAAWQIAERFRFVNAFAGLLARLDRALREHEEDVGTAARYYHQERRALQRWITGGARFYIPAIGPHDFRRYAERYVDRIQSRLASSWDRRQLARCFRLGQLPLGEFESRALVRLPGLESALEAAGRAAGAPLLDESLASVLRERSRERGNELLLNTLVALADSSEPLARPRSPGELQPSTTRCLYGHPELYALFRSDPESARMLEEREVVHVNDGDRNNLMLCASLHGFPAHSLRKMLAFRAHAHDRDGSLPHETDDLVPLDVGRDWDGSNLFELAVLAKVLGILQPQVDPEDGEERLRFEELAFPSDLLRVTDELAFSLKTRNGEERLQRAVDAVLAQPAGIETLRRASERTDLSQAERIVLLDTLAEFHTRSSIAWNVPIIGEETTA
jgi:hypothetical protein